jgi:hypothetical protein
MRARGVPWINIALATMAGFIASPLQVSAFLPVKVSVQPITIGILHYDRSATDITL